MFLEKRGLQIREKNFRCRSGEIDLIAQDERYLVFVAGLYFLAAGVVLIVRSALGTTPISSVNYVMSLNTPLTHGTCTIITYS